MKSSYRCLVSGLVLLSLCLLLCPAFASEDMTKAGAQFPDDVIVVPMGTDISINDDDSTVTISNCPVEIKEGDTFVVYLQDLPIAYVANSVINDGYDTVIVAARADKSVYNYLDEEGVIELTPDMYEFVPAKGVDYSVSSPKSPSTSIQVGPLEYQDGVLTVTVHEGINISVGLSNLSLNHSFKDGNISMTLHANWSLGTEIGLMDDLGISIPLGEIRIGGVGKIALSLELEASVSFTVKGNFDSGFTTTSNGADMHCDLRVTSFEGRGEISGGLKLTAGFDILVAEADIYTEVGLATQVTAENHYHEDETVECTDFRTYVYLNVGAEALYYDFKTGDMKTIAKIEVELLNEDNSPYCAVLHLENGSPVSSCTQGMVIEPEQYGGITTAFSSDVLYGTRERVLETSVDLPCDIAVDRNYRLANGTLNLNGRTLTIEGDFIQTGGTLVIGSGKLIINGSYILGNGYAGVLNMSNADGSIIIDNDFVISSSSVNNSANNGTVVVKGNIRQIGSSVFNSGSNCNFTLSADNSHTISFEDPDNNSIGWINMQNSVTAQTSVHFGKIDMNGHPLVINGSLISTGAVDFQDLDPEPPVYHPTGDITIDEDTVIDSGLRFNGMNLNGNSLTVNGDMISTDDIDLNGGILTVTGTLYQQGGRVTINKGKLDIGGNYYMAGAGSSYTPGRESFKTAYSRLTMTNAQDEVHVGGNFAVATYNSSGNNSLTDGTMYIAGNFTQVYGAYNGNFAPSGNHKVVLNGRKVQTVTFEDSSSRFAILEITQPLDMYIFNPDPCWGTLIESLSPAVFGTPDFILPSFLLSIEKSAFEGINAEIVFVPDSCVSIGEYAFKNSSVRQIRIPANCEINAGAFDGCEAVYIFGTPGSAAEAYCATHDNCTFVAE